MTRTRYDLVAIGLHWTIALTILAMIPIAWWMGDALVDPERRQLGYQIVQIHKSVGLTILVLSLMRLAWRLTHRPPELPPHMQPWERLVATVTHWAFYALMIALPLTGWAYVSTGFSAATGRVLDFPTIWLGLFEVPHLPGFAGLDAEGRKVVGLNVLNAHSKLAWAMLVLAGLHFAAALKHQFIDRDNLLSRMLPGEARGRAASDKPDHEPNPPGV